MINSGLKATLAGLLAVGASGCMSMGGYGSYGSGYGDGYYDDGYGGGYAYNDRCYDAYDGYYDYYSQYDCYDRNDYNSRFSVNIGFGGGWWNDFYYPGSGYYMFDRYGARRQLYGNYLRYWGGRRAGHRWQRHGGHRDGYRGGPRRGHDGARDGRRDRSGVGGQIIDRVDRANDRPTTAARTPAAVGSRVIDRPALETRRSRGPSRQIIERIDRASDGSASTVRQPRAADRPARVERRAQRVEAVAPSRPERARPAQRRPTPANARSDDFAKDDD